MDAPTEVQIAEQLALAEQNIALLDLNFNTEEQGFQNIIRNTQQITVNLTFIFQQINNIIALLQNIDDSEEFNATILTLYSMLNRYNQVVAKANIKDKHDSIANQINGINQLLNSHIFVFVKNNGADNKKFQNTSLLFNGDYSLQGENYINGRNVRLRKNNLDYIFNIDGVPDINANHIEGSPNNFNFTYGGNNYVAQLYQFQTPPIPNQAGGSKRKRKRRRTRKNKRKSRINQKGGYIINNNVKIPSSKKKSSKRTSSSSTKTTSTSSSK
jgi:hypothetical protein